MSHPIRAVLVLLLAALVMSCATDDYAREADLLSDDLEAFATELEPLNPDRAETMRGAAGVLEALAESIRGGSDDLGAAYAAARAALGEIKADLDPEDPKDAEVRLYITAAERLLARLEAFRQDAGEEGGPVAAPT